MYDFAKKKQNTERNRENGQKRNVQLTFLFFFFKQKRITLKVILWD